MSSDKKLSYIARFLFEQEHKYLLLVPFLVYPIGFIYTLGLFTLFDGSLSFLNINFGFFPISFNYYLINGIYYTTIFILFPCAIGVIMSNIIVKIVNNYLSNKIKRAILKLKVANRKMSHFLFKTLLQLLVALTVVLPFIIILFCYFLIFNDYVSFTKSIQLIVNLLIFLSLGLSYFAVKQQIIENSIISALYTYSIYISMVSLVLFLNIFSQGMLTTSKAIKDSISGTSELKYAQVYFGDNMKLSYIKMEINSDVFIGYNLQSKKIDVVPMDKINRIETFNKALDRKVRKYDEKSSLTKNNTEISATIYNYYKYRFDKEEANPRKWINVFTNSYYQKEMNLMSPEIVEQGWKKIKKYNGIEVDDFLGYEISAPISTGSFNYNVYIVEYWKNETKYLLMQMKKEHGDWKIDKLNTTQSFDFYN